MNKIFRCFLLFSCFIGFGLILKANPKRINHLNSAITQQIQNSIVGNISDKDGQPIIGATIKVKGTTIATVSDLDGNFTMKASLNSLLEISYVGYQTKGVRWTGQFLKIILLEDNKTLDELVVVGFGTQKKVNLTGAVSSVDSKKLAGVPATNLTSMLEGKLPGVSITQTTGIPGRENTSIRIRGVGTMNNANPMILVDGIEASMDDINPNDIESVSVLKDAAAAAIYGTRAANGVILVTTKKGSSSAPKLTYNGYIGWQKAIHLPKHLSSAEYAELYNEGLKNEGASPAYTDEEIKKYRDGSDPDKYPNTDWIDALLKGSGFTYNHTLNVTGGSDKTHYMMSMGYYDQKGLTKNTDYQRYNIRINLDSKVAKCITVGMNSSLSYRTIDVPSNPYSNSNDISQFFRQANRIPNTYVNRYSDGSWGRHIDGNPIAWIESGGKNTSHYSHVLGSVYGEVNIIDGLTLKGIAGVDYTIDEGKSHIVEITYANGTVQGPNSVSDYWAKNMTTSLQALLNYNKTFGMHSIKCLLGVSREAYKYHTTSAYRKNFPSNELTELNAGSTDGWSNSGTSLDANLGSYFGRINYEYANRYLVEANLRVDGSSKFARGHRWGTFPSFSAGWRVSEEKFMKQYEWIDNLKIRSSWGKLGNHRTSDYQYIATIGLGQNYPFNNAISDGAAQTTANNENITWETTTEFNLGIDFSMKKGLFNMSVDYYNRYTDDILTTVPVTYLYGLTAPVSNAGAMRNKGIEVSLGHANKIGDFAYDLSGYIAYNKNKVEKYPNPSKGDYIQMEGVAWNSFYGYECIGKFQSNEEVANSAVQSSLVKAGDLKFKDQNGDGKIDADDRVVLGNTIPEITYGFNVGANYKNFDFSASFQGAAKVYRTLDRETMWGFIDGANASKRHLNRTIVENGVVVKEGKYPRTLINQAQNRVMSSFLVLNASYLRLKNLQIGYNIPHSFLQKINISRARIYVSGENLLTLTSFPKDVDPEVSNGYAGYSYPQVAIYTFGLDITF